MKLNKFLSLLCVGFLAIGTVACGDGDSSSGGGTTTDTAVARSQEANTAVQSAIVAIALAGTPSSSAPALTRTTETFTDEAYDCDPGTATYTGSYDTDTLLFDLDMTFVACDGLDGNIGFTMNFDYPSYGFQLDGELTYEDDCVITYTAYGYDVTDTTITLNGEFAAVCGAGSASCDFTAGDVDDATGIEITYDEADPEAFVTDLVAAYEENCTEE